MDELKFKKFLNKVTCRNEELFSQKDTPVIGWCGTYVPEEIILAFGFIPYRVIGSPIPLDYSKTYLLGNINPHVQSILECAIKGKYDFLNGIIICGSTDVTKRLFDVWRRYKPLSFMHLFDVPKIFEEKAYPHFSDSIQFLIKELENHFGRKVNKEKLKEAIDVCNMTRILLGKINNTRKRKIPPITSSQFLEISLLGMSGDKEFYNRQLAILLEELEKETSAAQDADFRRILLTGSFQDQKWLLELIEEFNAKIVCEDMCTRLRYFQGIVREGDDLIKDIIFRYLNKSPSATFVSIDKRIGYLRKVVDEFNIDAIIYYVLKFDDPYLFEYPDIKEELGKNIPILRIESEHTNTASGQIRTRLQAFIESLY